MIDLRKRKWEGFSNASCRQILQSPAPIFHVICRSCSIASGNPMTQHNRRGPARWTTHHQKEHDDRDIPGRRPRS